MAGVGLDKRATNPPAVSQNVGFARLRVATCCRFRTDDKEIVRRCHAIANRGQILRPDGRRKIALQQRRQQAPLFERFHLCALPPDQLAGGAWGCNHFQNQ